VRVCAGACAACVRLYVQIHTRVCECACVRSIVFVAGYSYVYVYMDVRVHVNSELRLMS